MSVQAMTWVLDHSDSELAARLVLLSIANHADAEGLNSYPSQATIAGEAHVSDRTVRRAVDELVAEGELCVRHQKGRQGRGGRTNYYQMTAFRVHLGLRTDCPHFDGKCGHPDRKGGHPVPEVRTPVADEPSLEPSMEPRVADEIGGYEPLPHDEIRQRLARARRDLRGQ